MSSLRARRDLRAPARDLLRGARSAIWIALALAALAFVASAGENRLWLGRVELVGPCAGARIDLEGGATELEAELIAGERRELALPLPARGALGLSALLAGPAPRVALLAPESADARAGAGARAGEIRWLGWAAEQPEALERELPRNLLARARPPVAELAPRPGFGALLWIGAAWLLALAQRRHRLRAAAIAALGALAAALPLRRPARVELVHIDGGAGLALAWSSGWRSLELDPAAPWTRLESVPEGAALVLRVRAPRAGAGAAAPAGPGWTAELEGGLLHAARRAAGAVPELASAWQREAGGTFEPQPLAPQRAEAGAPPGWLLPGLPLGLDARVGCTADGRWVTLSPRSAESASGH